MVPGTGEQTNGLVMHTKKKLTEKMHQRYQKPAKKEKTKILDEFVIMSDYNQDYAPHLQFQLFYPPAAYP
jgi:hypothetical protein